MELQRLAKKKRTALKNYVEGVVPRYSLTDFQSHFRLKRPTFEHLVILLGPYLKYNKSLIGRPSATIEKKLLVTLWMLANNCVYRLPWERT